MFKILITHCFVIAFAFLLSYDIEAQNVSNQDQGFIPGKTFINAQQLDINNIIANINSNGRLFALENQPAHDTKPGFELKDAEKHSIHAAGLWVGGQNAKDNKYHMMTPTFGQTGTDIFPGPVMDLKYYQQELSKWNRVWKVTKEQIDAHKLESANPSYIIPEVINNWPAHGDINKSQSTDIAPFIDVNNNSIYEPEKGDYPDIMGDQAVLFIYNDMAGKHMESNGFPLGVEIIGIAYAFDRVDKTYENTVFVDYVIRNRSSVHFTDVRLGMFTDTDLGSDPYNDYAGSDPERNTYYGYNANRQMRKEVFGKSRTPFQSVTLLNRNLEGFMTYNNDITNSGNPYQPKDFYYYLHKGWKDGKKLTNGNMGRNGANELDFMYDGSPLGHGGWSEKVLNNHHGDRRGLGLISYDHLPVGGEISVSLAYSFSVGLKRMQKNVDRFKKDYTNERGPFQKDIEIPFSDKVQQEASDITIFPNPMESFADLYFQNANDKLYQVNIMDVTGKLIRSYDDQSNETLRIERKGLMPGMYFIELVQGDVKRTRKIVVQ
jgi:hypothetical protein